MISKLPPHAALSPPLPRLSLSMAAPTLWKVGMRERAKATQQSAGRGRATVADAFDGSLLLDNSESWGYE